MLREPLAWRQLRRGQPVLMPYNISCSTLHSAWGFARPYHSGGSVVVDPPCSSSKKLLLLCLSNACIAPPVHLTSAPASTDASLLLSPYGATCIIHDVCRFPVKQLYPRGCKPVSHCTCMRTGHGLPCAQKPWLKARLVMYAVHIDHRVLEGDDVGTAQWCLALLWPKLSFTNTLV